ncbi:MAG: hypothetical protein HZB24_07360 [Desulfobacterales bacterium]|nr:hypothetical protein [Desulfobacterales bacterium]
MTTEIFSYFVLPLGTLAAILATWGFLVLMLGLLHKRKAPDCPAGTLSAAELSSCAQTATPAIDQADLKVRRGLAFIIATPLVTLGAYILGLLSNLLDDQGYALFGLAAVGSLLWTVAFLIHKGARERRREAHWHDAALGIVAQAVAPLTERGHVVFKDFRAENIVIDYLIIGPKGVFALQRLIQSTGGHSGPDSEPVVTYNGRALFYPHGREHLVLDWAHDQAERFSEWLSEGLETPLSARAILALPGWRVKRISADGISVINPTQLEALFQYIKPRPISTGDLQTIIARIQAHYAAGWSAPNPQSVSQPA